ncbi:thioredoxin domain-containing protein 5 homolog [Drosophila takahashii]|uniref:thioredoxin domain-containing protein 5 homolog n=1 Tax=Drosophila takahashii TaxID=29030 RepID=UPI001CF81B77|nr:thioredoxin domain-containing protein 5 [Drosophila takahashii]
MPKLLYFHYLLLAILICEARTEIFSTEEPFNITAVLHLSVEPRSQDDCTPGKVLLLTPDNFYETTASGTFFVKFYEPNCMGCEDFESTWIELAKSFRLKRNICFAEMNCENAETLCNDYELRYEPNLIWLENGDEVRRYDGDLTFEGVHKYVKEYYRANNTKNSSPESTNLKSVSQYLNFLVGFIFLASLTMYFE